MGFRDRIQSRLFRTAELLPLKLYLSICLLSSLFHTIPANAYAQQVKEYDMKAVFIFNFGRFIDWPESSFDSPESPIDYCVYKENPFGKAITKLELKTIDDRPVKVRIISDTSEADSCELVFISKDYNKRISTIIGELNSPGMLTVTESRGDGIISMFTDGGRIKFQISLKKARRAGLEISSRLMRLAVAAER